MLSESTPRVDTSISVKKESLPKRLRPQKAVTLTLRLFSLL